MRTMIAEIVLAWTAIAAGFATAGGFVAFISLNRHRSEAVCHHQNGFPDSAV